MTTPEFGTKVVRMTISANCSLNLAVEIRESLKKMKHCPLDYDLVDNGPKSTSVALPAPTPGGAPCGKSSLVAAIDLIVYSLQKSGKKYDSLYVRSKCEGSRSAYTLKQPLRDYLVELCEHPLYKNVLTSQINNVIKFLESNPKYRGITCIKVDLNLIEVSYLVLRSASKVYSSYLI